MEDFVVGGQRLRYELHGEGEPVVTVNNLAAPMEYWWPTPYLPTLTAAGYQVITFQHLGPKPPTLIDVAADVGELLDHLDVEPARVWGYSQGAWIAQELALLRPDRVRGAVMMATVGRRSAYLQLALDAWEDLSGREEELPELYAYLMLLTSMSPDLFANDNYVTAVGQMMKGTTFDEEAMQRSRFASASMEDRVEALAAVAVPCLVIGFERDLMALPAHGEEVADAIPGCRYIEIPGAAHSGMATHADEVMKHVLDFFASV